MSIGRTILDCKLALCHLASDMKYAGAVYEARTYGSVRGMRRKPHPTRSALLRQNPDFYADISSPVMGLVDGVIAQTSAGTEMAPLVMSIGTLIDPPICGVLDPLKTVFFVLKQSDYFLLCAPRPV